MSDQEKPLTAKQRLELMPFCKQKIDEVAAEFDRDIAAIRATENGHTVIWERK